MLYIHTYTCTRGIYTAAEYPEKCHFFLIGKSNSKPEGITGWLQIVTF